MLGIYQSAAESNGHWLGGDGAQSRDLAPAAAYHLPDSF